jgi:hypothetical protein
MKKITIDEIKKVKTSKENNLSIDTDINCDEVVLYVRDKIDMPEEMETLLNSMINKSVISYEQKNGLTLYADDLDMDVTITADLLRNGLTIATFIGYGAKEEIIKNEITVPSANACYQIYKDFYIKKLKEFALDRIGHIEEKLA